MGVMTRFLKLCKADIHGVMDQLEDRELLLKQYIREMEEELERKKTELEKAKAVRDGAKREYETYVEEIEKTEQDIAVAIDKNKDDIARFLIRKIKPMENRRNELGKSIENMDSDIAKTTELIERQRREYDSLKLRAGEFFHRMEKKKPRDGFSAAMPCGLPGEISNEEVEIELLRRKEALRGGAS